MIGRWLSGCLVLCAIVGRPCRCRHDLAPPLSAQGAAPAVVAIRNATIITATRGTIANGTVLVRDGKIAAVGTNVSIPAGADVYDAHRQVRLAGHHRRALAHRQRRDQRRQRLGQLDDRHGRRARPDRHQHLPRPRRRHDRRQHPARQRQRDRRQDGRHQAALGQDAGASDLHDSRARCPASSSRSARTSRASAARRRPTRSGSRRTRQGVEYVIRDAFTRAKAYRKDWQDYEAKKKAGQDVLAPRRDLQLDALVEMLEGKRLVHAHSYRADEILMLIRLADEMGFKITTFQHVLEGYKVAKEIAAHGAGASTFSDWWGYKMEAADAIPHNAALMTHKGVLVSINSDDAEQARRLNMEAAKAIRYGDVTEDQAFAMVTINPAKQLKIDNRVGSIEVGKDADLVVWNHHPLSHRRDRRAHLRRRHRLLRPREGPAAHRRHPEGEGRPPDDRGGAGRRPTARRPAPAAAGAAAAGAAGREVRRQGQRQRPDLGDHQRAHRHGLGPGDPEGHDRHQGQPDRGGRRERRRAVRRRSRSTPAARP